MHIDESLLLLLILGALIAGLAYAWGGLFLCLAVDNLTDGRISRAVGEGYAAPILTVALWPAALPLMWARGRAIEKSGSGVERSGSGIGLA